MCLKGKGCDLKKLMSKSHCHWNCSLNMTLSVIDIVLMISTQAIKPTKMQKVNECKRILWNEIIKEGGQ